MTFTSRFRPALALLLAVAGCKAETTAADFPQIIRPTDYAGNPLALANLANGAKGDFTFVVAGDRGGTEGLILITGLFADEYSIGDTFGDRQAMDRRLIPAAATGQTGTANRNLHRARTALERAYVQYRTLAASASDSTTAAELQMLQAMTYVYLAEYWCTGQPISNFTPDSLLLGQPLSRTQIAQLAIARFDSALTFIGSPAPATATLRGNVANAARVGKARAQLIQGGSANIAAAAATVAGIPATFKYQIGFAAQPGAGNGVYWFNWRSGRWTVADREGATAAELAATFTTPIQGNGIGINFRGQNDSRVQFARGAGSIQNTTAAAFNGLPLWLLGKYLETTSINIADGVEAQLIIAENQALNNDPTYLTTLNNLRANAALYPTPPSFSGFSPSGIMPPLTDPGPQNLDIDLVFAERADWLFAQGRRLPDLRRQLLPPYNAAPFNKTEANTYPGGGGRIWNNVGPWGNQVALQVSIDETGNTNYSSCDPTVP